MAEAPAAAEELLDIAAHFTARPRPRDIILGRNLDDGLHPTPSRGDAGVGAPEREQSGAMADLAGRLAAATRARPPCGAALRPR